MIKKQKIIALVVFLLGLFAVVQILPPEAKENLKNAFLKAFVRKQPEEEVVEPDSAFNKILGEITENRKEEVGATTQDIVEKLKKVPGNIVSQEIIREITKEIERIVIQKVEEVKEIPGEQVEKVKEDIKKEMYKEICGDWLKEE